MGTTYTDISFHELQAKLNKRENLKIFDVRTAKSFGRGHIKGSINVPYSAWSTIPRISAEEEVVIICYFGMASSRVSEQLAESHDKVFNFKGGMAQWQGEIETETIRHKWNTERIYTLVLGFLFLLSVPISFLNSWWGLSYSAIVAIVVLLSGITNHIFITKWIRSFGFK
ncbi:rhodanese-like domain-containing protein [Paenibacillus tundrae]|nr:rhodanese-like domain-containing protein [Paenibacillus tundrae]